MGCLVPELFAEYRLAEMVPEEIREPLLRLIFGGWTKAMALARIGVDEWRAAGCHEARFKPPGAIHLPDVIGLAMTYQQRAIVALDFNGRIWLDQIVRSAPAPRQGFGIKTLGRAGRPVFRNEGADDGV